MSIVEEIRQDRENGAKRLESEYKAGLMALARRFCVDESDASDLVNRTFAIVVENIDKYIEQSAFFGWMARILVNCHSKDVRRKSNELEISAATLPEDAEDYDACARVFREVDASLLRDAIEQLTPDIKNTLMMHYFMDMPIREVARVLAVPSGTVMWRLHYARKILGAKLGATIKKPVVALVAIGLFLVASAATAVAIGLRGAEAANQAATEVTDATEATKATGFAVAEDGSTASSAYSGPSSSFASSVPSTTLSKGEQAMNVRKTKSMAAAIALAAALPMTAQSNDYHFFNSFPGGEASYDEWKAAVDSVSCGSSESASEALTSGTLASDAVQVAALEGRYRTSDEDIRALRSDRFIGVIIHFL